MYQWSAGNQKSLSLSLAANKKGSGGTGKSRFGQGPVKDREEAGNGARTEREEEAARTDHFSAGFTADRSRAPVWRP